MTRQEVFEFLKDTKIFVEDKSEEIQKKAFEIGYKWNIDAKNVMFTSKPFLYLSNNGMITCGENVDSFYNSSRTLITADQILKIIIDDDEFKPFDKVLVRDDDEAQWEIQLFRSYEPDKHYPYICLSYGYKQCIPFEGNEHLLGTTNKPE